MVGKASIDLSEKVAIGNKTKGWDLLTTDKWKCKIHSLTMKQKKKKQR